MPTSLNESWRQFPSRNDRGGFRQEPASISNEIIDSRTAKPGGLRVDLPPFGLTLLIEMRSFVLFLLAVPLYAVAAFVGNDWGYMLPSAMIATLIIGFTLPLIEVLSLSASCHVSSRGANNEQEIVVRAKRLPFFGLLSRWIPSGYMSANLQLKRIGWSSSRKETAVLPLPIVLEALMQGVEVRLKAPALGRGCYEVESLEVATCFPFSMAWWVRDIKFAENVENARIIVHPSVKQLSGNFHSRLTLKPNSTGRAASNLLMQKSVNLKGLREFTERDSLNQIHWASSARSGKFLVREYEPESLADYDILFDLTQVWSKEQFELACTTANAMARYGYRMGFTPRLVLNPSVDWEPMAMLLEDLPTGMIGEELISELLARISPMPNELRNEFKSFEKNHQRDAVKALSSDAMSSQRVLVSLRPGARSGIDVSELQSAETKATGSISHIESDVELGRL